MTKTELVELINSTGITARENELYLEDLKTFPKIAYWEYIIEDVMASGDDYETVTNGPAWHHYYFRVEITEDMDDGSGT